MRAVFGTLVVLMLAAPAWAQDPVASPGPEAGVDAAVPGRPGIFERLGVTGTVRAGYWSSNRNIDAERHLGAGMLWLKTSRRLSDRVSFLAEGWTSLRGPLEGGDTTGELREAYVDVRLGRLDVRAGRQIIAWGRADGVNPTDNLSGQNLTLLVPDDVDRRLGTMAVRASYYLGDVSVTGVWLPEFRGHEFALPAPPPGVTFLRGAPRWPGNQWALRLEQTGRAVDWSVSYFKGGDTSPDLSAALGAEGVPAIRLSHHRVRVLGGDMAANLGRFGLRAEGAYVKTDDADGTDPFTKNPFVFVVAGADRTFGGSLNLNVQYLFRYVMHDPEAGLRSRSYEGTADAGFVSAVAAQQAILNSQTRRAQHGASFRLGYKWLHDTLEAEIAAAAYAVPSGAALRPKVAYALTDHWKVLMGAEILRGESASLFGLLRQNSTAYSELRWSF
jgi:hypothetical protein